MIFSQYTSNASFLQDLHGHRAEKRTFSSRKYLAVYVEGHNSEATRK